MASQPAQDTSERSRIWRARVDTGGTFTDCLAIDPAGRLHRAKLLSSSVLRCRVRSVEFPGDSGTFEMVIAHEWPLVADDVLTGLELRLTGSHQVFGIVIRSDYAHDKVSVMLKGNEPPIIRVGSSLDLISSEEAPVLAVRLLTGVPTGHPLPAMELRLATTKGTNALLERKGAPTCLFITQGFGDLLDIGDQTRPDLFRLEIVRPAPLYASVIEVMEQTGADGDVVDPIDLEDAKFLEQVRAARTSGIRIAAIALKNSAANGAHEKALAHYLKQSGFEVVVLSSQLSPFIGLLNRAKTTLIDAYLRREIDQYLDRIADSLGNDATSRSRMLVMTSAGGLVRRESFTPRDSLLSGPAGGLIGAAAVGRAAGFERVIAFDMGGTSTDVARFDGAYEFNFEQRIGDGVLRSPALAIESVAAGGGSICWFDGQRLRVGPQSAGSSPGPACYGAGGPLTLTDVNLLLGRLSVERFQIPVDRDLAQQALHRLMDEIGQRTGVRPEDERELLRGFLEIANERMAGAIQSISVRKGFDPRKYALVAFGGAGGLHACALADLLEILTVIVPPMAGLLSAYGLGCATLERFAQRQLLRPVDESTLGEIHKVCLELESEAITALREELGDDDDGGDGGHSEILLRRLADMRLRGQDSAMTIEFEQPGQLRELFDKAYRRQYGYAPLTTEPPEIESMRILASSATSDSTSLDKPEIRDRARSVEGPAVIADSFSTTYIASGWQGNYPTGSGGTLVLTRSQQRRKNAQTVHHGSNLRDLIELELFTNRFRAIVTDMGEQLRRTAVSTNIKERLDFSCAILDREGRLVVNAPHIPVHLGAMGECVREVVKVIEMRAGDVVITNHPRFGGSHLPDVTLIAPIRESGTGELVGYMANRAHHAEIGGARPGSMPPDAKTLAEEGVILLPTVLMRDGIVHWERVREALISQARFPSRAPETNLADIGAALASIHKGVQAMHTLIAAEGALRVRSMMQAILDQSRSLMHAVIESLNGREFEATERLDDGSVLRVRMTCAYGRLCIDFSDSLPIHPGNLNATPAIVRSAVLYVLRLMLDRPVPLNEGLLEDVDLIVPVNTLLNPGFTGSATGEDEPAVVGGNTEVSQRLVDALIRALGLAACSQGTMNNVLFGNESFGYYETIGGGSGATAHACGADGVHTHMTNTRITDPEVIEHRYPVRLRRFAIRRGSGGAGAQRGGDGLERVYEFLERVELSVLTQHRVEEPFGMDGGSPGRRGKQFLVRAGDGSTVELRSVDGCTLEKGDVFHILTPGGGGYG